MTLLIDDAEVEARLENCEPVYHRMGRGNGKSGYSRENGTYNRVPPFVKEIIAAEVKAGRKATDVARDYGVSSRTVLNFAQGRDSQLALKNSNEKLVENSTKLADEIRGNLIEKTTLKLMDAMESLNMEKLSKESPLNQSGVIRNLATTLDKLEVKNGNLNGPGGIHINFGVFVPPAKNLDDYGEPIRVIEKTGEKR